MSYDTAKARKAVNDPRWAARCTLMGCTAPDSAHDHHMARGHLSTVACRCAEQLGVPGSFGKEQS